MAELTVVFADITGSTGVFELLGNAKATQAITRLTQWIGRVCQSHSGHVVKYLGDGVLISFKESRHAIEAAIELQRVHQDRIRKWPDLFKMKLQVGIARGDIVEQDGDCYGDAVNLASRLSDLSGPEQILVSNTVIRQIPDDFIVRACCMGAMIIRGRTEPCVVHRIEWQAELLSEVFTVPGNLMSSHLNGRTARPLVIELSCLDISLKFSAIQFPVYLGRDASMQFVVQDPRVSRKHAHIEWRAGKLYLHDVSSYGTWVRFTDSTSIVALRRQECVLQGAGEIALGAPFDDFSAPIVRFSLHEETMSE